MKDAKEKLRIAADIRRHNNFVATEMVNEFAKATPLRVRHTLYMSHIKKIDTNNVWLKEYLVKTNGRYTKDASGNWIDKSYSRSLYKIPTFEQYCKRDFRAYICQQLARTEYEYLFSDLTPSEIGRLLNMGKAHTSKTLKGVIKKLQTPSASKNYNELKDTDIALSAITQDVHTVNQYMMDFTPHGD